jgi:very-short-patch-repair endonuclease
MVDFPPPVTRASLLASGMSSNAIDRALRSGRLQRLFPGTYATWPGAVPTATWEEAAVLYAGPGAATTPQRAPRRQGWRPGALEVVHVTIPEIRRVAAQPRLLVHRARRWDDGEVLFNLTPPRTRVDRTFVDLLRDTTTDTQVIALVTDLARARLTTPDKLVAAMARATGLRRRPLAEQMLAEAAAGVHSVLEHHFVTLVRTHALPRPQLQVRLELADGTIYYLDTLFSPYGVVVELDGVEWHSSTSAQDQDRRRDNVHALVGRTPLRYGWSAVIEQCCDVALEIGQLLTAAGWTGTVLRCGRSAPENRGQRSA